MDRHIFIDRDASPEEVRRATEDITERSTRIEVQETSDADDTNTPQEDEAEESVNQRVMQKARASYTPQQIGQRQKS